MEGCRDESSRVRREAIRSISRVIAVTPEHAGEVLPTLVKKCFDDESEVRNLSRTVLTGIKPEDIVLSAISILPAFKVGLLFLFVKHSFTWDPLTKDKTVPFILHTTFPQEIGRWNKEFVDVYVRLMRLELDKNFPGLLEHLDTQNN